MAIFLITVVVGMLNGLDLVEFDRNTLMTHVHAGTLGWITLGFFAACLWLFAEGESLTGWLARSPRPLSYAYGDPPDFMRIPTWLVFAKDHAMFIGVMSNGLFGLVYEAARERRSFWPWVDHV